MAQSFIEHVNVTVKDPQATAAMLCDLFGWNVRWEGPALNDGYTVHVGGDHSYLAVYRPATTTKDSHGDNHDYANGLNHIGVVVEDLDAVEAKVVAHGYEPVNHADYEPGRRFYFHTEDGVEIEVVSYHD